MDSTGSPGGCLPDRHIVTHSLARRLDHPGAGTYELRLPCVQCPMWRVDLRAIADDGFISRKWIHPVTSGTTLHVSA